MKENAFFNLTQCLFNKKEWDSFFLDQSQYLLKKKKRTDGINNNVI